MSSPLEYSNLLPFFNAISDALLLVNRVGTVDLANSAACSLFGYAENEIQGLAVEALIPESLREQHRQDRQKYSQKPTHRYMTNGSSFALLLRTGEILSADISLSPLQLEDSPYVLVTIRKDRRTQAENSLRQTEGLLRQIQSASQFGTYDADLKMGILRLDQHALDIWGILPDQVITFEKLEELVHPDDNINRVAHLKRALNPTGNGFYQAEYRIRRARDGIECWLLTTGQVTFEGDQPVRILGMVQDITERKNTAADLRYKETLYRTLVDQAAPDAIFIHGHRGQIVEVNQHACESLGYSREELLEMNVLDIEQDFDLSTAQILWDRSIAGSSIRTFGRHRRKDGSIFPVEIHIGVLSHDDQRIYIAFIHDITQRTAMEKALLEQRESLQSLAQLQIATQTASAIAHEINQPLTAIAIYSEVALHAMNRIPADSETLQRALQGCVDQAHRAGTTLHELLSFIHNHELVVHALDINQVVLDSVSLAKQEGYSSFNPILQLDSSIPPVLGNTLHIQKVLLNLLRNSVEATRAAELEEADITIKVSTYAEKSMVLVTVQDNGPGLDAEATQKIFDPFFTTKSHGIGMGLSISRALIEAHGGQLWVDPEFKDGAAFHFTLPFAS